MIYRVFTKKGSFSPLSQTSERSFFCEHTADWSEKIIPLLLKIMQSQSQTPLPSEPRDSGILIMAIASKYCHRPTLTSTLPLTGWLGSQWKHNTKEGSDITGSQSGPELIRWPINSRNRKFLNIYLHYRLDQTTDNLVVCYFQNTTGFHYSASASTQWL